MQFKTQYQLTITSPHHSHSLYLLSYLFYILNQNKIDNLHIHYFDLPKKIKKFTLLKSPHVHKTARTQLETRTIQKVVFIKNISTYKLEIKLTQIIKYLIKHLPAATRIMCKHQTQHTL